MGGGSPGYDFMWSNGDTTQNISGVVAALYTVTITDINNCTITASMSLTQPAPVQSTEIALTYSGGNNVSCFGASDGSIDVTPSGGVGPYTFLWSTSYTSQNISGITAGSYTVTTTDINGCTTSATIILDEPAVLSGVLTSPTFAGGYNVSCGGSDGSIDLVVTGGNTAYSYIWSNGDTTQNLDSLTAGTYTVTITDANGCIFSDDIILVQPGAYSSSISSTTYTGGYNITCNGASNGAINLTMTGGTTPYTYIWSTGDSIEDLSGLNPGTYTVTVTDDNNCTLTASITLSEPPVLQSLVSSPVNAGGFNISCFGGADGSASVTGIDGTPGYSYLWSNANTASSINGLSAGTFYVTITDANNCTIVDSIILTEPPALAITSITSPQYPGGWNISCNGGANGEVTVTAMGGSPSYSYNWSNGETTQTITNVSVTTYIVTVTDVNGCTSSSSITLTEPQLLTASITAALTAGGTNVSCNGGSDGSANLTVIGGTAGFSYLWSNSSTMEDPTGLSAGLYTVTITDTNGCTTTASITLIEPAGMNSTSVLSDYNGSGVSCNSSCDGSIDVSVSGGSAPYSYMWNNSAVTQDLNNLCEGAYSVIITDANGCTTTQGGTITEPAPANVLSVVSDFNGFGVSCASACDGSIEITPGGGTSPYVILWSNGETTTTITGLCAGTYTYTVTDANNCTVSNSIDLIAAPSVTVSGSVVSGTCNTFCDGAINITIGGGATPYTFIWSSGEITQNINNLCAGNYSVTITDANGCSITDNYMVTDPAPITVIAGVDQNICGGSTTLSGNTPVSGTGTWSLVTGTGVFSNANDASSSVSGLSPGLNTLEWTINDGPCSGSSTVNIFSDEEVEAKVISGDITCERVSTLQAESPQIGSGYWTVSGNSNAVIDDPFSNVTTVSGLVPGPNIFIWTVTNGLCSDTARVMITVDGPQQCDSLQMPTGISPNSDGYNDEFVVIGLLRYPDNELIVFNRWGNEVYVERNYANTWKGVNKSGDNLPDGTYFVILKVNNINQVLKGYLDIRR